MLAGVLSVSIAASFVGCRDSHGGSGAVSNGDPTGDGTGTALIVWSAPSENTDGSSLADLDGYNIYYGTSPGDYSWVIELGVEPEVELPDLDPGTYYFAVTAVAHDGRESEFSSEVSTTIYSSSSHP